MDIKQSMQEQNFRYNKQFGQNFIYDVNLLSAIARDADISKEDYCLEIGAGAGTLTKVLASCSKQVLSYEIDRKLKDILTSCVTESNVEFVFEDFMKSSIADVESKIGVDYKVVANLPYYITSPIIMSFVEQATRCLSLTVMVQKEVAERLVSTPGTKQYGAITVAVSAVADVVICRKVPAAAFTPRPEVDSAVVKITFNRAKYDIKHPELFRKLVKGAFAMRRKTLENNLLNAFSIDRQTAQQVLKDANIPLTARGETLSVRQFADLSDILAALNL